MRRGVGLAVLVLGCADESGDGSSATGDTGTTMAATTVDASSSTITDTATSAADSSTAAADTLADDSGSSTTGTPGDPQVILPRTSIVAAELGVLVNDMDAQSVAVAQAYAAARSIPAANVVHLQLPLGSVLSSPDFAVAKAEVDAALGDDIQALAITWTQPYRVDCMSVTSAFALGFDTQYCSTPCSTTTEIDYYDSSSLAPWTDHGIRPAMMLAGDVVAEIEDLVDRGVASDGTRPFGDGYLVRTTDVDRSVRFLEFMETVDLFDHEGGLALEYVDNADGTGIDWIEDTTDVLFYFTGLASVPQIATNTYLPGAMADHLTSYGGEVPTSGQMSCVAWLKAGATGSYGTVVEPCNYPAKFPDPRVAAAHYFRGQTLVEAYWKSVRMPGEGLFVGEPLARPWDGAVVDFDGSTLTITTTLLAPGVDYDVQAGDSPDGPWQTVFTGSVPYPVDIAIEIADATAPYYRLVPS
ncbi:MAG TPA: TIGR03790 family protein [Nannocystaceae bacterium]|nr:TIGR03790 family protein [Nannocystaceae bacterium]